MTRVLLTGASGQVGRELQRAEWPVGFQTVARRPWAARHCRRGRSTCAVRECTTGNHRERSGVHRGRQGRRRASNGIRGQLQPALRIWFDPPNSAAPMSYIFRRTTSSTATSRDGTSSPIPSIRLACTAGPKPTANAQPCYIRAQSSCARPGYMVPSDKILSGRCCAWLESDRSSEW